MRYFDGYDHHGEEKGLLTNLTNLTNHGPVDLHLVATDHTPAPQTYGLSHTIVAEFAQAYDADDAAELARDRLCRAAPSMALLLIESRGLMARLGEADLLARINTVLVTAGMRPCPPG